MQAKNISKYRMSQICHLEKGKQIDTGLLDNNNPYAYINGGIEPSGYYTEYNTAGDTITVSEGGASCGYVNYITEPYWCGCHCYRLTDFQMNPKYIYYALKANQARIMRLRTGSAMPNIKKSAFESFELALSDDKDTQDQIVHTFDLLTLLIQKRNEQLSKLDNIVKARFVEMFGDVIQNDKDWEQYTFSDITTSRLGKMLDAKQQTGEYAYPYLANFNVQWFRFEIENLNKMDFNEADRQEFELRDGDLLVCEGGEIGRCAVWHNEIQPCYFQKALHRVRCNQRIVLPDYMAWWFKYNCDHKGFVAIEGAKATISHLPGAKLKALKVTVPPIDLQTQFVAFLEQVDKSKVVVQKALDEAQTLFDSWMQQYFG